MLIYTLFKKQYFNREIIINFINIYYSSFWFNMDSNSSELIFFNLILFNTDATNEFLFY